MAFACACHGEKFAAQLLLERNDKLMWGLTWTLYGWEEQVKKLATKAKGSSDPIDPSIINAMQILWDRIYEWTSAPHLKTMLLRMGQNLRSVKGGRASNVWVQVVTNCCSTSGNPGPDTGLATRELHVMTNMDHCKIYFDIVLDIAIVF